MFCLKLYDGNVRITKCTDYVPYRERQLINDHSAGKINRIAAQREWEPYANEWRRLNVLTWTFKWISVRAHFWRCAPNFTSPNGISNKFVVNIQIHYGSYIRHNIEYLDLKWPISCVCFSSLSLFFFFVLVRVRWANYFNCDLAACDFNFKHVSYG